jgi:Protein of unknown function (DUF3891)
MAASLRADPKIAGEASPENIERNRLLIAALDWMSLEICWGVKKEIKIPDVPAAKDRRIKLSLYPRDGHGLTADPWPFREESIMVRAEGKRLSSRYSSQEDLQRALDEAEAILVTAVLHKA